MNTTRFPFLFAALVLSLFAAPQFLAAQTNAYRSAKDSDPEARRLVEALRKKYDAYRTLSADFRLDIALPEQPVESQKGTISREGDFVRFKLGNQEGIVNADAAYIILHGNKEVQINNLPEAGEATGVLTPQTLFSFYEGEGYVLSLQGEQTVKGRRLKVIELKPVDRAGSEFTKLRLLIDQPNQQLVSVKAFSSDGSNFTFHLDDVRGNVALPVKTFVFDKADFPGYYVEDLRY